MRTLVSQHGQRNAGRQVFSLSWWASCISCILAYLAFVDLLFRIQKDVAFVTPESFKDLNGCTSEWRERRRLMIDD
jgi:hypothetical protein